MKLSLNWIKDYVELPADLDLARLSYDLTMATVEVEGADSLADKFENMCVGIVRQLLPHPNADKLTICMVDLGDGEDRQIVCGGINLYSGMKVAVARPGAKVRWHGEGDLVEIGNAKVRGEASYGMICASSEIGLFDLFPFTQEATIVDLSNFDAKAGDSLAQALGLDDVILEIDNKSMTNRPDLWGHYGIARELSALYDVPLKQFVPFETPEPGDFTVSIQDTDLCSRYIGVKIEGLCVKPSPFEIQSRLWRVGLRPINAIVDITNYVMLATGQPTHAFDSDAIKGSITVRRARPDEKLLLLNGKELSLSPQDLVIADDADAVGLAGVMGGSKDSVLPNTSKVILELASFNALAVRLTAGRHEMRTEAATRFEKGIDPQRDELALSLAMAMFAELFPGMKVTGYADAYPVPLKGTEIDVSLDWLEKRLGKRLEDDTIKRLLVRLGFEVTFENDTMHVTSPSWRSTGDIDIPDDIMEEVSRLYGFENFEATKIETSFETIINQLDFDAERNIKEYLAFRCGMQEIFSYPWVHNDYLNAIFPSTEGMLSLSTPPSPEEKYLRSSLIPNMCKAISSNLRYYDSFSLFEVAQVFFDRDYASQGDSRESLPYQRRNVAGAFVGRTEDVTELYRKAKGTIEMMPRHNHLEPFALTRAQAPVWADPIVWQNIEHAGQVIGSIGLLSRKCALDCGIKTANILLFEFDLDSIQPLASRTNAFVHLPEYPITEYDLSLLFDGSVKWEEIKQVILSKKGPEDLLRDVRFVDEYRGKQVPQGKKSVTLRLVIGSLSKTLTSEEIENAANAIVKRLSKNLGAELRS